MPRSVKKAGVERLRLGEHLAADELHLRDVGQVFLAQLGEHLVDREPGQAVEPGRARLLLLDEDGINPERDERRDEQGRHRRHGRLVPLGPAGDPREERLAVDRDRLVGQPVLEVVGQVAGRAVAVLGPQRHRLQADRVQGGMRCLVDRLREERTPPCGPCTRIVVKLLSGKAASPVRMA